ncbi:MAG: ABC transporter ATP-binding protein [Pseudomonadota bacterium]
MSATSPAAATTGSGPAPRDERWQVRIRALRKRFGANGAEVLRGVDLDLERGKVNVVIGGSGQGKSVLIKHIIGLLQPDSGHVWVDGVDVPALSESELWRFRRRFGMVFQTAALFDSLTVEENVAFPLVEHTRKPRREIHEAVLAKLASLGLEGAEKKFPGELSGGMRKRVGLARALVLEPEILLYDEPTTGLDPLATENVDRMITDVADRFRVTSIVISHDMASVFRIADRIAMIHEGIIVQAGSTNEVRQTANEFVRRFITTSGVGAAVATAATPVAPAEPEAAAPRPRPRRDSP